MAYGVFLRAATLSCVLLWAGLGCSAQAAEKVRISQLADVAFGEVVTAADLSISQSVCVHSSSTTGGYSVIANGNGAGGAFLLSSGSESLPYEVQWAEAAGQVNGIGLQAGTASQTFQSSATHQFCNVGPPSSASLIVKLPAAATMSAQAGAYAGTLSITIVPE